MSILDILGLIKRLTDKESLLLEEATLHRETAVPSVALDSKDGFDQIKVSVLANHVDIKFLGRSIPGLETTDDVRWVQPGDTVTVGGYTIKGGMVYVGSFMRARPGRTLHDRTPAPCLINPGLPVAKGRPRWDVTCNHWPSYANIGPDARNAYLSWLASGKTAHELNIGLAFLYFYGIERRLLIDVPDSGEEEALVAEVSRLRSLFGANASFVNYANNLLDIVALRRHSHTPEGFGAYRPDLAAGIPVPTLPLKLRIALLAARRQRLDFETAFAGAIAFTPQARNAYEPALSRSRAELVQLSRLRFNKKYPKGLPLNTGTPGTLSLSYQAASQYLDVSVQVKDSKKLSDPASMDWFNIGNIIREAALDLEDHARTVGRNTAKANSIEAALTLPAEIRRESAKPHLDWLDGLDKPIALVACAEVRGHCLGPTAAKSLSTRESKSIAGMLARFGYGMEPDCRHGGIKPQQTLALFRDSAAAKGRVAPAPGWDFAMAAMVAAVLCPGTSATSKDETARLLIQKFTLGESEALRLRARIATLPEKSPTAAALALEAQKLRTEEKTLVAELAANLAGRHGDPGKTVMTTLERLYGILGLSSRDLYGALYAVRPAEPVTVERGAEKSQGFRIPKHHPRKTPPLVLDMSKVASILRETEEISGVLAEIYTEEEHPPPAAGSSSSAPQASRFAGLDARHAALLTELMSTAEWNADEFAAATQRHGLMVSGVLETVNEWALDTMESELIEEGETFKIDLHLLTSLQESS